MSKIEWTDQTWNPVTGCTRVSPGCDHCYITRTPPLRMLGRRWDGDGPGSTTGVWLHPERLGQPSRWKRPRRVFVNSLSDLFHPGVPDEFIADVFARMATTGRHTFQLLTKRPARMKALLTSARFGAMVKESAGEAWIAATGEPMAPLENVWLGVSVEDQQRADQRIPLLLDTPAAVRFLSCEPLLGPVDLWAWLDPWNRALAHSKANPSHILGPYGDTIEHVDCDSCGFDSQRQCGFDWVIVGGESGPGARPMHPDWARSLRDQCTAAGVAYFFKQWGEWTPIYGLPRDRDIVVLPDPHHAANRRDEAGSPERHTLWSADLHGSAPGEVTRFGQQIMRRVGKKAAGRELDGRTWDEFPEVAAHDLATLAAAEEAEKAARERGVIP